MTEAITLEITEDKLNELTWEQWEIFDNGSSASYRDTREIVAMFVSGMDQSTALAMLGKLKTPQMKSILEQFVAKVNELREVNPTTGDG